MDFTIVTSTIDNKFWSILETKSDRYHNFLTQHSHERNINNLASIFKSSQQSNPFLTRFMSNYFYTEIVSEKLKSPKTISFIFSNEIGKFLISSSVENFSNKVQSLSLIEKFSSYNSDWDGYGANSFSPEFLSFLEELVIRLDETPLLSPTGTPSVIFSYSKSDKKLLFEIFSSYYHFVIKQKKGKKSAIIKSGANMPNNIHDINNEIKVFLNEK